MKGWGMRDWDDGVGAPRDQDGRDVAAEGWVGDLLRAEAARHQPDRDRIMAAIVERRRADRAVAGTVSPLDGRRRLQASRRAGDDLRDAHDLRHLGDAHDLGDVHDLRGLGDAGDLGDARSVRGRARFAWPMVAASVAVLTMATVAGARALAPDASPDTTTTVSPALPGNSTLGPAITIEGSPTPDGPGTRTSSPTSSSEIASADGSPASTTATTKTKPAISLSRAVSVRTSPTGDGTRLSLPRNGDRDWIAVGGQDGRLVRAKRPDRPLGTVTVSGAGPLVASGPYDLSWQDGVPVPNAAVGTWQSITADGRMRITVPLRGDRFTVDLFAGTVKAAGLVSVSLAGSSGAVTTSMPSCSATCAEVISVTVDSSQLPGGGTSGELIIDLGPARPGNGGRLGLAAVVLH
jgi:hypothetical protein